MIFASTELYYDIICTSITSKVRNGNNPGFKSCLMIVYLMIVFFVEMQWKINDKKSN